MNITLENGSSQRLLEEYHSTNGTSYSISCRYIYGSFVDDVLGFYKGSYQFYYHHSDRQYNSRCLTDDLNDLDPSFLGTVTIGYVNFYARISFCVSYGCVVYCDGKEKSRTKEGMVNIPSTPVSGSISVKLNLPSMLLTIATGIVAYNTIVQTGNAICATL